MRMNNPEEMTIVEQLEAIAEEVCDRYCKYPGKVEEGLMSEKLLEEICKEDCPFRKINFKYYGGGLL